MTTGDSDVLITSSGREVGCEQSCHQDTVFFSNGTNKKMRIMEMRLACCKTRLPAGNAAGQSHAQAK